MDNGIIDAFVLTIIFKKEQQKKKNTSKVHVQLFERIMHRVLIDHRPFSLTFFIEAVFKNIFVTFKLIWFDLTNDLIPFLV